MYHTVRISYRPRLLIEYFPVCCDKLVLQLQWHIFLDNIYRIKSGSYILEWTFRVLPRALNGLFFCGTPSTMSIKVSSALLRYEKEKNLLHEMTLWCYSSLWERTVRFYEWTCFAAAWLQSNCKVELCRVNTHTHTRPKLKLLRWRKASPCDSTVSTLCSNYFVVFIN